MIFFKNTIFTAKMMKFILCDNDNDEWEKQRQKYILDLKTARLLNPKTYAGYVNEELERLKEKYGEKILSITRNLAMGKSVNTRDIRLFINAKRKEKYD